MGMGAINTSLAYGTLYTTQRNFNVGTILFNNLPQHYLIFLAVLEAFRLFKYNSMVPKCILRIWSVVGPNSSFFRAERNLKQLIRYHFRTALHLYVEED